MSPLVAFFLGYAVGGAALLILYTLAKNAPLMDELRDDDDEVTR